MNIECKQEVAKEYGLQIIDLHTLFGYDSQLLQDDGIHPNDKGVRRIADIISEALK